MSAPSAKPRRPAVLLDTGERLLPFPLPAGRTERLKIGLPQRPAELCSCRLRLRPRGACAQQRVPPHLRGSAAGPGSAAAAPRALRGSARGSLGGAGGGEARSCPGAHRERVSDPAYKLQQRRAVSHLNVCQLRSALQAPPDHWTSASKARVIRPL